MISIEHRAREISRQSSTRQQTIWVALDIWTGQFTPGGIKIRNDDALFWIYKYICMYVCLCSRKITNSKRAQHYKSHARISLRFSVGFDSRQSIPEFVQRLSRVGCETRRTKHEIESNTYWSCPLVPIVCVCKSNGPCVYEYGGQYNLSGFQYSDVALKSAVSFWSIWIAHSEQQFTLNSE